MTARAPRRHIGGLPLSHRLGVAVAGLALAAAAYGAQAAAGTGRDLTMTNPPFPRIANCYGAGLGWESWAKGAEYWSKLDLFIGGCYDLHYDWDNPRWPKVLARVEENVAHLRKVNPNAIVLPYVDVVEGPDNPAIPKAWWDLRDGKRWSGWPGYCRINTSLPAVLQYNLDKVRTDILSHSFFDGVFYDCWHPDNWLVPRTAKLRDGHAIVMVNNWNLPATGFADLNGCLAEDELNRVVEGKVDFEDFLARYLRWTRDSRRPPTTTIVCHPRGLDMDEWRWAKASREERAKTVEAERTADPQMMRFGLTTALMGDGYFAYDCANLGRGQHWWYPEYDAPLGHPLGPAHRSPNGIWERRFDGGLVVVNGTAYDAVIETQEKRRDLSTGRVGHRFTVPMYDGRILLPSDAAETTTPDVSPRITATPPSSPRAVALDEGRVALQTPGGLDLRFEATGELDHILFGGRELVSGGWPVALAMPSTAFRAEHVLHDQATTQTEASVRFRGELVQGDQRVGFAEECTASGSGGSGGEAKGGAVRGDRFTLRFDFTAETDLDLRMWRHYFFLPVSAYAGAAVTSDRGDVTLPAKLGSGGALLAGAQRVTVTSHDLALTITSSVPMSLVDHRKYGTPDYLLAGYPVGGTVAKGKKWSVEMTLAVARRESR